MRWHVVLLTLFAVSLTAMVLFADDASAETCSYDDVSHVLTVLGDVGDLSDGDPRDWDHCIGDVRSIVVSEGVRMLGNNSFYGCSSVISISLPSTLERLGMYAFGGCVSLTHLMVRSDVVAEEGAFRDAGVSGYGVDLVFEDGASVANRLFWGSERVTSVDLGTVTRLSERAFYGLEGTVFTSMSDIVSIGDLAMYGCTGLTSLELGDCLEHLGVDAFYRCSSLKGVRFSSMDCDPLTPSGVFRDTGADMSFDIVSPCTSIPSYLFVGTDVDSLTIDDSVVTVMGYAFHGYDGAEVILPVGLVSIGDHAFDGCTSLHSLTISESMIDIGKSAFDGCSGLNAISFSSNLDDLTPDEVFFRGTGAQNVSVSVSGVSRVPDNLFLGMSGMTSLTLDDSIVSIGDSAFAFCTSLGSVALNKVSDIGDNAFLSCDSLQSVSFGSESVTIGDRAFSACDLGMLVVPNVALGTDVLSGNRLDSISFRGRLNCVTDSLSDIGGPRIEFHGEDIVWDPIGTFSDCDTLDMEFVCASIPDGLLRSFDGRFELKISSPIIGDSAFKDCANLMAVEFGEVESIGDYAFHGCPLVKSLSIPCSVRSIGQSAFANMTGMEILDYGASDVTIVLGSEPFTGSGTTSGMSVTVNGDIPARLLSGSPNVSEVVLRDTERIGDRSFFGLAIDDIDIPDSVAHIGEYAFSCSGLTDVTLPKGVIVDDYAFSSCLDLVTVDVSGLRSIPDGMFEGCTSLDDVGFSFGLESIGTRSFSGTSLGSIQLPYSLSRIGDEAFASCQELVSVTLLGHDVVVGDRAFEGCPVRKAELQSGTVLGEDAFSPAVGSRYLLVGCPNGTVIADCPSYSGQGQGGNVVNYDLGILGLPGFMLFSDTVVDVDLLSDHEGEFHGWLCEDGTVPVAGTYGETTLYGSWIGAEYIPPSEPSVDPYIFELLAYAFMTLAVLCIVLANLPKRAH